MADRRGLIRAHPHFGQLAQPGGNRQQQRLAIGRRLKLFDGDCDRASVNGPTCGTVEFATTWPRVPSARARSRASART